MKAHDGGGGKVCFGLGSSAFGRRGFGGALRAGGVLIALAAVGLSGCKGDGEVKPISTLSRAEVVRKLNADAAAFSEFTADLSIYADVEAWDVRGTVSGLLALAPGDRMALWLSSYGRTFLEVTSDGQKVYFLEPKEKRLLVGTLDELKKSPNRVLGPETFRAAFLAEPLPDDALLKKLRENYVFVIYARERREGGVVREVYVDPEELVVRRLVAYDADGYVVTEVSYDRYKRYDGTDVPTRIVITSPRNDDVLKVQVNGIELETIPERRARRLFAAPDQKGLTVEPLSAE